MNFKSLLIKKTANIYDKLLDFLPAEEGYQKTVFKAMNYSLLVGGKRVRPLLMKESYECFGGNEEVIYYFMAAIEMIHTYSLVHDDLPCMDNDTLRRGKPTTWNKFGEDMGVLTGDALYGFAFETALKGAEKIQDKAAFIRALKLLADKAGCYGMLGGQVVDVELTGKVMTEEQMEFVYRLKTSALIESALMIGGALAGANEEQLKMLEEIGCAVGLAFQIKDDILDMVGDEAVLGKPINSDEKNSKITYASLHGIEAAEMEVKRLSDLAADRLEKLPGNTDFLKEYFDVLVHRDR